jgi:hypothetical protein
LAFSGCIEQAADAVGLSLDPLVVDHQVAHVVHHQADQVVQTAQHRLGAFAAQFQLQPEMAQTAGRLVDLGNRHRIADRLDQHGHFRTTSAV